MERLLKSRYKIKEKIGENPFSVTYKGAFLEKDGPILIKIYKRSVLSSSLIKSVKRKVKNLCAITHPNIAKVVDGDYGWQGFYFVREFVKGKSLADILKETPKLEIDHALDIALQITEGLLSAHEKGIIHGALNLNNVFIVEGGIVKLTDFIIEGDIRGAIKERAQTVYSSSFLTPEEVRGEVVTARSDIYCVGLLLYAMLTGLNPFQGASGLETSLKTVQGAFESPRKLRADIPEYVEDIIFRCLEGDPLMRFATVKDILASLKAKSLIEDVLIKEAVPDISLGGLIDSASDGSSSKTATEEREGPNIRLVLLIVLLGAVLGIGWAAFSVLYNR